MRRALLPVGLFVALSCVSSVIWQSLESDNENNIRRGVADRALHARDQMRTAIQARFDALARLAKRFEEWAPPRSLWEADVGRTLVDFPEFQGIAWIDTGNAIRWFLPKEGNEKFEGSQADAEVERREAIRVARETRALVATRTVDLVQGRRGFTVFAPLFRNGEWAGSIVGVFAAEKLVRGVIEKPLLEKIRVEVREGDEVLYQSSAEHLSEAAPFAVEQRFAMNGFAWRILVSPTRAFLRTASSSMPEMTLASGLGAALLISLMALGFITAQKREKRAETARLEISRLNEKIVEHSAELEAAGVENSRLAKTLEADLAVSQSDFRAIIENAPIGVGIIRGATVAFVNACLARSLGFERPSDVVGLSLDRLVHPLDLPRIREGIRVTAAEGVSPPMEIRGIRKGGGETILAMSQGRRINFEGASAQFAIFRDVTEERRLHEQISTADRLATIGLVAAGVAHEINNPLAAAVGNLSYLDAQIEAIQKLDRNRQGIGGDDLQELAALPGQVAALAEPITDAREALERVRIITRDLKMFARSADEKKERVDVERVIEASLRIAWPEVKNRARLVKEYSGVPPVFMNEARLGQVILNLVVNAAQAIPMGDRNKNQIRVRTMTDASGNVVIRVSDTGSGITPENLAQIWDPFFTTKRSGEGTGLGLSITKRLVDDANGRIAVESVVGEGTTFTVTLPAAPESAVGPTKRVEVKGVAENVGRAHVLVVDDEAGIGNAVRRLLEPRHSVVVVASGVAALEKLRSGEKFDVVLLDVMMPEMDGIKLFARLKDEAPVLADRTIFMTGGMANPQVRGFLESVANPRLEKPFDARNLAVLVNERLGTPKAKA